MTDTPSIDTPKFIMLNLNSLSPETIVGIARDNMKLFSPGCDPVPLSKSHEYKSIFHILREHLDELKGKDWTDTYLPVSDWSVI